MRLTDLSTTRESLDDWHQQVSPTRLLVFRALRILIVVSVGGVIGAAYVLWLSPGARGLRLNKAAWEASYVERGLAVPKSGPREGYWGARLGAKVPDLELGWHESRVDIPGLVKIDQSGRQHYACAAPQNAPRLLVIGGSVAFGAYASSIKKTYFHVLGDELEKRVFPGELTVIAAGGWKSSQDVRALLVHGPVLKPDVVIFVSAHGFYA